MAKKKQQFELGDEFGFDGDLDMPDMNFDSTDIKDDRKALTKVASGFKDGVKDSVMSPSFIRKLIRKSLPDGYGSAMDLADQTAGTIGNLYNDAAKEAKPVIKDMKRVTKRLLPAVEAAMPRKMAEKIKKWSENDPDKGFAGMNAEQMREASLQAQLGDIFKFQSQQQQQDKAENETRETIRDSVQHDRHRDMLGQLDAMRVSLQQLASYQEKVDVAYKRKSLEVQYRHYFVAVDALEEQKKYNAESKTNLDAIMKNTALPDFVKLKNSERLHEALRNKFIDNMNDTVFARRREMIGRVGKNMSNAAMEKFRGFMDNFRDGIGAADGLADLQEMQREMAEMGGGPSRGEMAGQIAGSVAAESIGKRAGKGVRKLINRFDTEGRVDKAGNSLQYFAENVPQTLVDYAKSDKHETGGMFDGLVRTFKDAIFGANREDTTVLGDSMRSMQDPIPYNRSAHKSITEIIPGYLARMLRELQITRTGDETIQLTAYDFASNKFVEKTQLKNSVFRSIVKESEQKATKDQLDEILKEVDPDGTKLNPAQRKALGEFLLDNNLSNNSSSEGRLKDYDTYTGKAGRHAGTFSDLFSDYFADNEKGVKNLRFSRMHNRLGTNISDAKAIVQDHINTGNRDVLEELGILKPGSDAINMQRLREYMAGENATISPDDPQRPNAGGHSPFMGPPPPPLPSLPAPSAPDARSAPAPSPVTIQVTEMIDAIKSTAAETIAAIKEHSSKAITTTMSDTLLRIEEKIKQGVTINFGAGAGPGGQADMGGGPGGGGSRWWQRSLGDMANGGWELGKKGFGAGRKFAGNTADSILGNAKKGWGFAKDLGEKGWDKAKKYKDVYVDGELIPRIQALKLKAGDYYYVIEDGKKKFVKDITDITGDVFDRAGELVMSAEDAKKAFYKAGPVRKLLSTVAKVREWGARKIGQGLARLPGVFGTAQDLAKKAYDMLLDGPQDVYIQGNPDPVLLARTMRVGGYSSRITSNEIRKVSDIDGPVVDSTGQVVLSAEDIAKGLLDKNGKPIKTGLGKIVGAVKGAYQNISARAKKLGQGLWDKGSHLVKGMGDWFKGTGGINIGTGMFSNNSVGGNSSKKLLLQIRDLLNTRLPGEPTSFDDKEFGEDTMRSMKERGAGLWSRLRGKTKVSPETILKAKEMYQNLKDKGLSKAEIAKEMGEELFALTKSRAGSFKERAKEGLKNLTERTKKMFGVFAKKDGLEVSGMTKVADVLAEIRERLPEAKKKVLGDADGDGVREGSYMDTLRKKKDALKDRLGMGKKADGEAGMLSKLGGMKGLMAMLGRKKGDEEEDDEDDEDGFLEGVAENAAGEAIADRMDGDGDGKKGKKKRRGRRGRGPRGGGRPGLLKRMGSKIGWGGLGKSLGLAGAAYGGYSAYQNLQQGNYGEAAVDAGLSAAGLAASTVGIGATASAIGGGIMTAGGALLAGAGALISAPILLTGLAVGALGYGAYKAYGHITRKRLDAFSKMRYAQYGFMPDDETHLQTVLGLEDELVKGLVYDNGVARLDEKKIDFKEVVKKFDVDLKDGNQVNAWLKWFLERFKPVYLVHMSAINKVAPQKTLNDIADLKPEQKKEYLSIAKFPTGPYDARTSPFADLKMLPATGEHVKAFAEQAQTEIEKQLGTKADSPTGMVAPVGMAAAASMMAPTANQSKEPGKISAGMLAGVTAVDSATGLVDSRGVISAMGVSIGNNQFATGKVDALPAIRYKTYGLKELVLDKARALDSLERYVNKEVQWGKGNVAKWEGSVETALKTAGPAFGVDAGTNNDSANWMAWFSKRFLPVYMNYLTALANATNKTDIAMAYTVLKPAQMVDVAIAVYTTSSAFNGSSSSVWQMPSSPWPNYELNSDVKSVEGNVNGLKEEAKRIVLDEQTGKTPKGQDAHANPAEPKTFLGQTKRAISEAWTSVKDTVTGFFGGPKTQDTNGGRDIVQPGGGTGGDINSIPKPTGNKSWAALKDTITAAAKMVGVDEKMMATMAAIESGFDYTVKAKTSSASGLYQFIDSTWQWMLQRYGPKYGIAPNTPQTDPRANALMGAEYMKLNIHHLQKTVNRPITDTDVYMAHFLGSGGAKKFFSLDPNALAANAMPKEARANASIFFDNGRPRTVSEVYALMNNKVRSRGKSFGLDAGAEGIKLAGSKSTDTPPPATAEGVAGGVVAAAGAASNGAPPVTNMGGKSANALSVPVANQAPGAQTQKQAAPTVTAMAPAEPQTAQPVPADAAAMAGFMSPRARDAQVQAQYQQETKDKLLGSIEDVSKKSLKVQQDTLKVMETIRNTLLERLGVGKDEAKAPPAQASVQSTAKIPQAAPKAVVSMAKPSY